MTRVERTGERWHVKKTIIINVCGCFPLVGINNDRQCPEFGCRGWKGPRRDGQPASPQPSEKSPASPQRDQEQEHAPHVREDLGVTEDQRRDPGHPVTHIFRAAQGGRTPLYELNKCLKIKQVSLPSEVLVSLVGISNHWDCKNSIHLRKRPWQRAGRYIRSYQHNGGLFPRKIDMSWELL